MVTRKETVVVLDPEVVPAGETRLEVSAEQLEALADAWEQAANILEANAGPAFDRGRGLGDLALGLVTGAASQLRADCLRDCAGELRALAAPAGNRRRLHPPF